MRVIDEDLILQVIDFVTGYQVREGKSPTFDGIAWGLRITKPRAHRYVHTLADRGILSLDKNGSIEMPKVLDSSDVAHVPLMGAVRCGTPSMAVEDFDGMYKLPRDFTGSGSFFMLRAKGDSMINAGIVNGDFLVIREQQEASIGDIVVAIKESEDSGDSETTLKRLVRNNGRYYLRPENEAYEDIDAAEYRIIGKLKSLIRTV